jgi:hypothetical protein
MRNLEQLDYSVNEFGESRQYYSLNYTLRTGAALRIGNAALKNDDKLNDAQIELDQALKFDPLSPELLALAVFVNLKLNNMNDAQKYYDVFKQVDKKSPLIDFIKARQ